jgi:hypothetical protein
MGSDRVSSNRAVERPVRPFAVDFNHNNLSVLTTCKSFHDEVKPIFWSKATFVFRCTRDLNHFIKQRTIVPVPHALTNLENFQHVRLANDDLSNTRFVFRGCVIACLANVLAGVRDARMFTRSFTSSERSNGQSVELRRRGWRSWSHDVRDGL